MHASLRAVAALLLSIGILVAGNGLLTSLIGLRMAVEGYSEIMIGLIASAYFAGLLTGSLLGGRIIARVGHIRSFAALAAILCASALTHSLLLAMPAWMVLRFVAGLCAAGLFMVTESWLHAHASNATRGQIFAVYMTTFYAMMGIGQFLLATAEPGGPSLFIVAAILLSLSLVPVSLSRASGPAPIEARSLDLRRLAAVSPLGLFGAVAAGFTNGAFYGLGPAFGSGIGLDAAAIGQLMAATILGGLVLQWPIGKLSDRLDRRQVLLGVALALAAASLALLLAVPSRPLLLGEAALYGGLLFVLYPLCVAHAQDFAAPEEVVPVSGGLILAYSAGAVIGPFTASALMEPAGPGGLFLHSLLIAALLGGFIWWRMRRRPPVPEEERARFVAMPRTTAEAMVLDPRAEESLEEERPAEASAAA